MLGRERAGISKSRRKRYNFTQIALTWMVLTVAAGMLGVGFAAWQQGLDVLGIVSTGEIDPVFTSVRAVSQGDASIINNGKAISIFVDEAYPGSVIAFEYTLENRGSVPVEFHTRINNSDSGLSVNNTLFRGILGGNWDSAVGEVVVQVEDEGVEESSTYNFYLELFFQQWSGTPR